MSIHSLWMNHGPKDTPRPCGGWVDVWNDGGDTPPVTSDRGSRHPSAPRSVCYRDPFVLGADVSVDDSSAQHTRVSTTAVSVSTSTSKSGLAGQNKSLPNTKDVIGGGEGMYGAMGRSPQWIQDSNKGHPVFPSRTP